jgi:hypothetical protein
MSADVQLSLNRMAQGVKEVVLTDGVGADAVRRLT